ncbi:MAG: hypothetical protein KDB14_02605 [Planctomycetales bacterium]|nr:hypothetical protein [Planctomycetales bacterium]
MTALSITGYSTALFSTWYFVEQYGLLFDCGDGCAAGLLQKAGRVRHIFLSHADRDHLNGLPQFLQLNSRPDLAIYYPRDCGSFPALEDFLARFDPHLERCQWRPLSNGDAVPVGGNRVVRAVENRHVRTNGVDVKSLSYFLEEVSHKLRPEFRGLPGEEIARLRKDRGSDAVTEPQVRTTLAYSGDTPVDWDQRYHDAEVLIHEATFLTADELAPNSARYNLHSSLDDVLEMVRGYRGAALVLGHFSCRYSNDEIRRAIEAQWTAEHPECTLHLVLPGERVRLELPGA